METILITGGTGLIGRHLSEKLKKNNYNVILLSRTSNPEIDDPVYKWNPEKNYIDPASIDIADCIIHLAGAGIGDKRWTKKRKQLIADSRIKTSELILNKVRESGKELKSFISASGTGYYGAVTKEKIFTESDPPAGDFIGEVCKLWEQSADRFRELGIRTVKLRTGIVLAPDGGAVEKMISPVKLGIGSSLGSGRQYIPWIHIDDLCSIYLKAIQDPKMKGTYNAVAPDHTNNREFMQTMAGILGKPFFFPSIPELFIRLLFGKMSDIILKGSRVSADKIISAGYTFEFPELGSAMKNLFTE
jgi:uncharacterized protein (TIGR01777 family)